MRLSKRQKNILRRHAFSAIYAIGPDRQVAYATEAQAEALEEYLSIPQLGHNYRPDVTEFLTLVQPVRFGFTSNPADNMASTADGWAFHWEYKLLGRIWFEDRSIAETVIKHMQQAHPAMRKSWINISCYPGRELFDLDLVFIARDLGYEGMDDLSMLERLEDLEYEILKKEIV